MLGPGSCLVGPRPALGYATAQIAASTHARASLEPSLGTAGYRVRVPVPRTYEMITCSPKYLRSALLAALRHHLLSPYTLHSKTSTAIFEDDPSGSPNKTYMAVISDRNYTI